MDGILTEDNTMTFAGVEGYFVGMLQIQNENIESTQILADSCFRDPILQVNITDEGKERNSEITMLISTDFKERIYMNPVFQRNDGTYYTDLGQAMGMSMSGLTSGASYSQTIDNIQSFVEDGIEQQEKFTFKLNIKVENKVIQSFIKEINQEDELIKITEYKPNDPEDFTVASDTDYVIVEEIITSNSEDTYINRFIYSLNQEDIDNKTIYHTCNFPGEKDIIESKMIYFRR